MTILTWNEYILYFSQDGRYKLNSIIISINILYTLVNI